MYELFQDVLEVVIRIIAALMILAVIFMTAELYQREKRLVHVTTDAKTLIKKLWKEEWPIAHAIVMAESRYKPDAVGDEHLMYIRNGKEYGDSIGIFQIRTFEDRPDREILKDPYINIYYAYYRIYSKYGWGAWGSYNNKSYIKFLPVLKPTKTKLSIKEVSI